MPSKDPSLSNPAYGSSPFSRQNGTFDVMSMVEIRLSLGLEAWLLKTTTSTASVINCLFHCSPTGFPIILFLPRCDHPLWFKAVHHIVVTPKQIILPTILTVHHTTLTWIMDMDTVHLLTTHYIPLLVA